MGCGIPVGRLRAWALALGLAPAMSALVCAAPTRASSVDQAVSYQEDAAHDGHVTSAHLTTPLSKLWSVELGGRLTYPLIVNGIVYVTVAGGGEPELEAMEAATGKTLWSQPGGLYGATYDNGRLFTGLGNGDLVAYDAVSGNVDWTRTPEGFLRLESSPTAAGGIVYFTGYFGVGAVFAVRESDGQLIWLSRDGNGDSSPAVASGSVYVNYACQEDYAFGALSGTEAWRHSTGCTGGGGWTPVVAEGLVYARDSSRPVAEESGIVLSSFEGGLEGTFNGTGEAPAVADGTAYVQEDDKLVALSDAGLGAEAWSFEAGSKLTTPPIVSGNLVLVGSESGEVYALQGATGELAWSTNAGSPILGHDEHIIHPPGGLAAGEGLLVVSADETLVAYGPTSALSGTPESVVKPEVDGSPRAEGQVTADVGVWTGEPTSYSYQWISCDEFGSGCANIEGATSATYTPGEGSVFSTLRVKVTATNGEGSASATSQLSAPVATPEPLNQTRPVVTGRPWVGSTLTSSTGTWSGDPTRFEYQWFRCRSNEHPCTAIAGATRSTYTATEEDRSNWLQVLVTPADAGGPSPPAESGFIGFVRPPEPPGAYESPKIAGSAEYPGTLTASSGPWSEEPTSIEYQWFVCESFELCVPIKGATGSTYELSPFDVGEHIKVGVTALNPAGPSQQEFSAQTTKVGTLAPESVTAPSIEGSPYLGSQLTANVGRWTGAPTGFEYVWLRCERKAELCEPIEGAIHAAYQLTAADMGQLIALSVIAHNGHGYSIPVFSEAEGPVRFAPVEPLIPPAELGGSTPGGGGSRLSTNPLTPLVPGGGSGKGAGGPGSQSVHRVIFGAHVRTSSISGLLSHGLRVSLKCADSCTARVVLVAPLGPHGAPMTIGQGRFSLTGGIERTVVVALSGARRALRSRHRITVTADVKITDSAGGSSERSLIVPLGQT